MTSLDVLPWVLSFVSLYAMWLAGSADPAERKRGWALALWGQSLWLTYTFLAHAWGFLPLNLGLAFVYGRSWWQAYR